MWSWVKDSALSDGSDFSVLRGGPPLNDASALGFTVATTANVNEWLGVTTEGGAAFFSQDLVRIELFDAQLWTLLAGPKFTIRQADRVAPFVQLLAGAAYFNANVPLAGLSENGWDFALQPGGGVDIVLSDLVAVRVGFDARILFDKVLSGDTSNQFRFTTGITFRSDFK